MGQCLSSHLGTFMQVIEERNPGETEFLQTVLEIARDIIPFMDRYPEYRDHRILERLTEADRIIIFRVSWVDDRGEIRINRGYRVQHSNAIGPYKGGIRFRKGLRLCVLKALALEQTLKNSLTGLPMGGAKGGANFDPKGRSDREIMSFCQQYMTEFFRYIGPNVDIPAGDVGVGEREISYMFGQYKRISNKFAGALTGKGISFGGSLIRKEATGYGCAYIIQKMLNYHGHYLEGKRVLVSGAGNVALHTIEKLVDLGAKVVTASDSSGFVYLPHGMDREQVALLKRLKLEERARISVFAQRTGAEYFPGERPWRIPCDIAVPSAIQHEIDRKDAETLVLNGCMAVVEGANIPCTPDAVDVFLNSKILFLPSKAANAGGVAVSGMEMTQNSMRLFWSREELDIRLRHVMEDIHKKIVAWGDEDGYINYRKGANIAGFIKVADAMVQCGIT